MANVLNRFAVSSWMPFKYNSDGSLDLYFQSESPDPNKEANWLPAPTGPFNVCMRLYSPKSDALGSKWNPPPGNEDPSAVNASSAVVSVGRCETGGLLRREAARHSC